MRNIIVGTAGHIDHGKTALVKALTGTDADRLPEERRRGITIELGFAHLQIADDLRLGFVDVPGHERFVRNMLAGAAGIDIVLFVVAADESIKPQTREHFEICRLLGVNAGLIAITKADLVDSDLVDLVSLELDDMTRGSFLQDAPKIAVSSASGSGIAELKRELESVARSVREKSANGFVRMPIDRAFTMNGFGTVVTGTMIAGSLDLGDLVELYPTGRRLRIRGLQVYGGRTGKAAAGERTAVNLMDIEPGAIERGMVLSEPARLSAVSSFLCRLEMLESVKPLKNGAPVHLHIGSAGVEARVRFFDGGARVVLSQPALVLPGDRFIIRSFSPVTTIGGGIVADIGGRKSRTPAQMDTMLGRDDTAKAELLISESPNGISEAALERLLGIKGVPVSPSTHMAGDWRISKARVNEVNGLMTEAVCAYHRDYPLMTGMPKQELKGRCLEKASPEIFESLLAMNAALVCDADVVRLKSHRVALNSDEERAQSEMELTFEAAGLNAPSTAADAGSRSILQILLRQGKLVRINNDLVLHRSALDGLSEKMVARQGQRFTVPEFKAWTGVSRKYAIPILEYLDRTHVTRRVGDERLVL